MKFFFITTLFGISIILSATLVHSQTPTPIQSGPTCQPIYGGGETCVTSGIAVNKTIKHPTNDTYLENFGVNTDKFNPDQTIQFRITVTNTGNSTVSQATVTDTFPQFTTFVSGPGKFDQKTKKLTWTVDKLNAKESQTFDVKGKFASASSLPTEQGVICVVNQIEAKQGRNTAKDAAQICVQKVSLDQQKTQAVTQETETPPARNATPSVAGGQTSKGGLPVYPTQTGTSVPATGPEMFGLLALLPTGIVGFLLRKRSL